MKRTSQAFRYRIKGVTLVELVAFIAIVGIVAVAMVQAFSGTMRGSHMGKQMTQAMELVQGRMELIQGKRVELGYTTLNSTNYDPCKPVSSWTVEACQTGNYTVDSNYDASSGTYKEVTVTVTGPYGDVLARLTARFWDY